MIDYPQLVINALTKVEEISVNQLSLKKQQGKVNLIDVREENEVLEGVIPGSVWIPRGLLEFQIVAISKQLGWNFDDEVFICCRSGNRSALAALSLLEMGFKKPISVAGGYTAWRDTGYASTKEMLHF